MRQLTGRLCCCKVNNLIQRICKKLHHFAVKTHQNENASFFVKERLIHYKMHISNFANYFVK